MVASSAGGTLYGCRVTRLEKWCIIATEAPECLSIAGRISHWHHIFFFFFPIAQLRNILLCSNIKI